MVNTTISTTIPQEIHNEIKKNHYKINELILMGLQAKKNNPVLMERINTQEIAISKLQRLLTSYGNRINEIEGGFKNEN